MLFFWFVCVLLLLFFFFCVWVSLICFSINYDLEICYEAKVEGLKNKTKASYLCVMGNEAVVKQAKMLRRKFPRASRRKEPWLGFLMGGCLFNCL